MLWVMCFALVACSSGSGNDTGITGGTVGESCMPGQQQACACPGGAPDGVQVCADAGDRFGPCMGCEPAETGSEITSSTTDDPASSDDGAPRCSGWENMGQNAWDYLDYIVPALTCDAVQKTQPFDITGYAGQTLWFGAHNHPQGGGSGTTACIAIAK